MRRLPPALLACAALLGPATSTAAGGAEQTAEIEQARELFKQGAALAKDAQWGAALAAFERSARLRPHPWTTFNIAVCERALAQYVRAKRTFSRALAERTKDADLPESTVADVQRYVAEIDGLLATLDVHLAPADASIAVDGEPLEMGEAGDPPLLLAGVLPAGPGKPPPASHFRVVLDPGHHVFHVTREGFADAVHEELVRPGEKRALDLAIERLPATLNVSADQRNAVVTVNALDVGVAPVSLSRPGGTYHVIVRTPGFVPYEVDTLLRPGQATNIRAALKPESKSLLGRWWFWTAAGVVVAGAAVTTYALTRPAPERPPVDGGGMGWTVKSP